MPPKTKPTGPWTRASRRNVSREDKAPIDRSDDETIAASLKAVNQRNAAPPSPPKAWAKEQHEHWSEARPKVAGLHRNGEEKQGT
jgi:hypothetical protein